MIKKMISISKLQVNKGQIERLPRNPRFIKGERFEKLKKSIQDMPSMLDLRELIVYPKNGHFVVIGGNMRLRAAKDLGLKELPCKVLDKDTPPGVLAEIAIKDNIGFGSDDYDIIANEWADFPLTDWGMDVPDYDAAGAGNLSDFSDKLTATFLLEISCESQYEQETIYKTLKEMGLQCRILTL